MSFTRADYPPLSTLSYISTITSVTFSPTSIAGCRLWVDAADPAGSGVIPANGASLTTWVDKSGTGINLTGTGSPTLGTYNGLRIVNFSSSYFQNTSFTQSGPLTIIFIGKMNVGGWQTFSDNVSGLRPYVGVDGGTTRTAFRFGGTPTSNVEIWTLTFSSSDNIVFNVNGTDVRGSVTGYGGIGFTNGVRLGFAANDSAYLNGWIGEYFIYNTELGSTQYKQIEGYLAWKWGIQASLPGGHTYASSGPSSTTSSTTSTITLNLAGYVQSGANYILKPIVPLAVTPYYTAFNPIALSTLALWIDGADPLGTGIAPAQSTLLSTLKDKSGNNRAISTFSTTVGFPTYRTAANGALGAIQLAAGNGLLISSISMTPYMTLYAVYSPILPSTGIAIEQGANALSNAGFLLTSVSTTSTIFAIGTPAGIVATGGTVTTAGGFKYHVFTASGTFTLSSTGTISYLIVGGGGGGGDRHGAGGGAGGVLSSTWAATPGSYTITVGLGGLRGATSEGGQTQSGTPAGAGSKGGDSSISSVATAYGGGGGGTLDGNPTDTLIGSGGGGGGGGLAGRAGTAGQGFAGGSGNNPGGGGGGGAGGAGVNADTATGGIGTSAYSTQLLAVGYGTTFATSWVLGTSTYQTAPSSYLQSPIVGGVAYIAGGGGGNGGGASPGGAGGAGGGGRGDWDDTYLTGGTANTGGGGGASRSASVTTVGRDGGSGLVLLWYPLSIVPVATGGTITTSGAYKIHTFTTTGNTTFTLTSPASITAQVLVVGGGGAGGSAYVGGGGGAGGAVFNGSFTIASGSYTVTVGAGGVRTTAGVGYVGPSGANSSFSSITGTGGGGGGSYMGVAATNGGCGGGGPFNSGQFGTGSQGGNGAPYGTDGNGGWACGGGGGGMGGTAPTPASSRPNGGAGATYTVAGTAYTLAGGGGAGSDSQGGLGRAGGGLGGNGNQNGQTASSGADATANTGSGGGGGGGNNGALYGGAGGSGIVIIAYLA